MLPVRLDPDVHPPGAPLAPVPESGTTVMESDGVPRSSAAMLSANVLFRPATPVTRSIAT